MQAVLGWLAHPPTSTTQTCSATFWRMSGVSGWMHASVHACVCMHACMRCARHVTHCTAHSTHMASLCWVLPLGLACARACACACMRACALTRSHTHPLGHTKPKTCAPNHAMPGFDIVGESLPAGLDPQVLQRAIPREGVCACRVHGACAYAHDAPVSLEWPFSFLCACQRPCFPASLRPPCAALLTSPPLHTPHPLQPSSTTPSARCRGWSCRWRSWQRAWGGSGTRTPSCRCGSRCVRAIARVPGACVPSTTAEGGGCVRSPASAACLSHCGRAAFAPLLLPSPQSPCTSALHATQ